MRCVKVLMQDRFFLETSQSLIILDSISGVCSSWHTHRSHPDVGRVRLLKAACCGRSALSPVLGAKVGNAIVSLGEIYSPPTPHPKCPSSLPLTLIATLSVWPLGVAA